jgi:signal transduction histidine kinase
VVDQGIGIVDNELARLFKPYFKTDSVDSLEMNPNGNGLGLSICKNIAKSMQGDLTASSELDIGSCFTLTLNLKRHKPEPKKGKKMSEDC